MTMLFRRAASTFLFRKAEASLSLSLVVLLAALCGCRPTAASSGDESPPSVTADGGSAESPVPAAPKECALGCPAGYACADGVCRGSDTPLAIDLRTVPFNGVLTVDGAPPRSVSSCTSDVLRVSFLKGLPPRSILDAFRDSFVDVRLPCSTTDGSFATRLPAGTYRVLATPIYSSNLPSGTSPLADSITVSKASASATWNLQTVAVTGRLTVDGDVPRAFTACNSDFIRLSFVNDSGAMLDTRIPCSTTDGAFSARLPPGNYRVFASPIYSSNLPSGTSLLAERFTVSNASASAAWDLRTLAVSGRLTVDGDVPRAFTSCNSDFVRLSFINDVGTVLDARIPCGTTDGAFSARLPPGNYRVLATPIYSSNLPNGTSLLADNFTVSSASTTAAWNLRTVAVSGRFTVDGETPRPFTTCSGDFLRLSFVNDSGAMIDARVPCSTTDGAFSARLPPGNYRVLATPIYSSNLPNGTSLVAERFTVSDSPASVAWDLHAVEVSGRLTVDGDAPRPFTTCTADFVRVSFVSDSGAMIDARIPCSTTDGAFSARLPPGTYRVLATPIYSSNLPNGTVSLVEALAVP